MKKSFVSILAALLFCMQSFSQTAEQDAIKKVCLDEAQAYTDFNYDTWASYHVQSAEEQLAWNNPDGTFGFESGWEAISNNLKDYFRNGKKETLKLSGDNFSFVIHNDMAFVSFNRGAQNAEGKITRLREYRTMLNKDGQWKILAVQAYVDYPSGK